MASPLIVTPTQDAHCQSNNPDTNYSTFDFVSAGWNAAKLGYSLHGLLDFDLTSLPAGATIGQPSLALSVIYNYGYTQVPAVSARLALHQVTGAWAEGGVTWIARGAPYLDWSTPGGDFGTDASPNFGIDGTGWKTIAINALRNYTLDAIVNESGILRLGVTPQTASGPTDYITFRSKEYALSDYWPVLTVPYTVPSEARGVRFGFDRRSQLGGNQIVTFGSDE